MGHPGLVADRLHIITEVLFDGNPIMDADRRGDGGAAVGARRPLPASGGLSIL